MLFMYRFKNNSLPHIFKDFFKTRQEIQSRPTRYCKQFDLPKFNNIKTAKSIKYMGIKIWNNLINLIDLSEIKSYLMFKNNLDNIIMDNEITI